MKLLKKFLFIGAFSMMASSANAVVIDFQAMAEAGGSHGESAWDPLTLSYTEFGVSITATQNGQDAYAYLDSGNGGLGVCGRLYDTNSANSITNSGSNLCNLGSDDNVTTNESLFFVFDTDVTINTIWFNNNHDGDRSLLGDMINIGGSAYTFTNGGFYVNSFTTVPYNVAANTVFEISFNNEQFYVDAMDISASVPAPASIVLLGLGLFGIGAIRRKA